MEGCKRWWPDESQTNPRLKLQIFPKETTDENMLDSMVQRPLQHGMSPVLQCVRPVHQLAL